MSTWVVLGLCAFAGAQSTGAGFPWSDWMGELMPIIGNQTILDISTPGTHDTLTYDLSETVSDGGIDGNSEMSKILHDLGPLVPGNFIRKQAEAQIISVTDQLNAGVRYLDYRMMMEANGDWRALHFVQSKGLMPSYMQEVKEWLIAHPKEVITMQLTKHGNTCATGNAQYPKVSVAHKQAFWKEIVSIFSPVLADNSKVHANVTTIAELVSLNQRMFLYVADYVELTSNSTLALDACKHNAKAGSPPSVTGAKGEPAYVKKYFPTVAAQNKKYKAQNTLSWYSFHMATADWLVSYMAKLTFQPLEHKAITESCAKKFNIPAMTDWCPGWLPDLGKLNNYYHHRYLSQVPDTKGWMFPPVIMVDQFYHNGTLLIDDVVPGRRYALGADILLSNVRRVCDANKAPEDDCAKFDKMLVAMRAEFPVQRWDDGHHGRMADWPLANTSVPEVL
eukprot:NODE_1309_length_1787_cov_98.704327_g1242_i0.p1 GENE.NODE_1309_length_1787_cov_98.704327_g1242_i0~~NODE_1309_length_1787_cov_98.704327_g1242_i0.p1  ORF type:complete len:475 (-),score=106.78 NODE_1309_length_1787_cov_98.704327_g1242_i0:362-1708(-)